MQISMQGGHIIARQACSVRMTAMRVYLGCDHAGFELKNQIIDHLTANGHEPSTAAPTPTTPWTTTRRSASRPRGPSPTTGSLGIVLGGSGNGEQIAANKVPGARCALAWSVETAQLARQHNNAQLIGIGGRMHTLEEALAIVDAFLATPWSGDERHQRRIDILAEYERTGDPPPLPAAGARRCPRVTPSTGWPGCTSATSRVLPSRVQPAGPVRRRGRAVDGRVLVRAEAWGKHLFHHYEGGRVVHVHLGLYGTFTELAAADGAPVGQVRMRMVGAEIGTDLRGPTACEMIDEPDVVDVVARLGPGPAAPRRRPGARRGRESPSPAGPIGALLMDQAVIAGVGNVYRAELLFRHRIDPYRPGVRSAPTNWTRCGPTWSTLMKVGVRRGKIIVVRPEHDNGAPSYAPGPSPHLRLPPAGDPCRVCGTPVRTAVLEGAQPVLVPELPDVRAASATV